MKVKAFIWGGIANTEVVLFYGNNAGNTNKAKKLIFYISKNRRKSKFFIWVIDLSNGEISLIGLFGCLFLLFVYEIIN